MRDALRTVLCGVLAVAGTSAGPLAPGAAAAQEATGDGQDPAAESASPDRPEHPGAALRVFVLSAQPGDAVWEQFGHNALRIVDAREGTDVAWNWGLFDFSQEGFIPRLARGTMLYSMGGTTTGATLEAYRRDDRAVWQQELDLTPEEKWELQQLVLTNFQPENRLYRYDYYRDNCSTRIRDLVDEVTGGRVRLATGADTTTTSYRWHTRRLLQDVLPPYLGIQYVLGNRADEPITRWQEMFLPLRLRDHLRTVTVVRDGEERPLVLEERRILDSARRPEPGTLEGKMAFFVPAGVLGGLLLALVGVLAARGSGIGRVLWAGLAGVWTGVSGLAGLGLALAWPFTDHVFWAWNENLLQAGPQALVVAAGVPVALLSARLPRWARFGALAVAGLSLLGLVLQPLPGLDQSNGEIIALALPLNLGLAVGAVLPWVSQEPGPDPTAGRGSRRAAPRG